MKALITTGLVAMGLIFSASAFADQPAWIATHQDSAPQTQLKADQVKTPGVPGNGCGENIFVQTSHNGTHRPQDLWH